MSGLKQITVNTPTADEAHIYAEDDASNYLSMFGGDGVSTNGQSCKATVLSNNKVRIADGIICVGGHFARIPYGDYIDCEIENGQSGKKRKIWISVCTVRRWNPPPINLQSVCRSVSVS